MNCRSVIGVAVVCLLSAAAAAAQEAGGPRITPEEFEARLGYQSGTVHLEGGFARIRTPDAFRFLGPEGSRRLLTQAWGNPEEASEGVLGMLVPARISPLAPEGWGIVITYDESGYVKDEGAASIDYSKLLKEMQEATVEANRERKEAGYEPVTLVGWAEPPTYDPATHKMYWAKDLMFGSKGEHTLNYSIRILGRRGVLVLNAVAPMTQLTRIRQEARSILPAIDFNEGHRYTDYLPGKDKAASYGLAGLVVGATAAKAGFFKVLWVGLLGFKKLIVVGVVGALSALKRLFGKKPQEPTPDSAA